MAAQAAGPVRIGLFHAALHCVKRTAERLSRPAPAGSLRFDAIIHEEMRYYLEYLRTLEMKPITAELRQRASAIRQAGLEKSLQRLPDLVEDERRHVEVRTRAMVKKLLHAPTTTLRAEAGPGGDPGVISTARRLFGLYNNIGAHRDQALLTGR